MARRAVPLIRAALATAVLAALVLVPLGAVLWRARGPSALGPADWAAIRFTLLQAALSAAASVALAVPAARALARRRFRGRGVLITLLGAPFLLPVIVAILGLVAIFGRGGVLNAGLAALGLPPVSVYGMHGVVLAHVFFNLPLATRLLLQGWLAIPAERFRLAASLDLGPAAMWRLIEAPMLRRTAPGAAMVVFVLCLTSFAVALTLGGGPRATTVELAIYQAFRFEFDLGRAALLAVIQMALTGAAALAAVRAMRGGGFGAGLDRTVRRWDAETRGARVLDAAVLGAVAMFLLAPLAAIVARGLPGLAEAWPSVWPAALRSAAVAGGAAAATLALAVPLALRGGAGRGDWAEVAGYLGIAASPLVLGTGLFLILFPWIDPSRLALPLTALVNAVAAVPFAIRALVPAAREAERGFGRLADSLDLSGWARMRWLLWPRMRRAAGFGAGLAAALSIGDLGVIALFADPDAATLPLQVYRLMAAYRMDAAAGAALILVALALGAFWLFDRGGRADAAA